MREFACSFVLACEFDLEFVSREFRLFNLDSAPLDLSVLAMDKI